MNTFIITLPTRWGNTEFCFQPTLTAAGTKYHVSVNTEVGTIYFFTMEHKESTWRIINAPKVPDWVMEVEYTLYKEIIALNPEGEEKELGIRN